MRNYYCTYADRSYLSRAIVLAEALALHDREDHALVVVCLDRYCEEMLARLALPSVRPVPIHAIEKDDEGLRSVKAGRSLLEYCFTMKPAVALWTLDHFSDARRVVGIDADVSFFSSPRPLFEAMGQRSALVQEHGFFGLSWQTNDRYNSGLFAFASNRAGRAMLAWWRTQCLAWCHDRFENGRYGDQSYLNELPERFGNVCALPHGPAGLAPWNYLAHRLTQDESGAVLVDDAPLIYHHFSTFSFLSERVVVAAADYRLSPELVRLCTLPYARAVFRASAAVRAIDPEFTETCRTTPFSPMGFGRWLLLPRDRLGSIEGTRIHLDAEWDGIELSSHHLAPLQNPSTPGEGTALGEGASNDLARQLEEERRTSARLAYSLEEARHEAVALRQSLSWKVTAPLRRGYELLGLARRDRWARRRDELRGSAARLCRAAWQRAEQTRRAADQTYERLRVRTFKDRHADRRRCFIVGNGPSILQQDLTRLRDEVVFVTNGFVLHGQYDDIAPTYYCISDHDFFTIDQERAEVTSLLRRRAPDTVKFFPYSAKEIVRAERSLDGPLTYYLRQHSYELAMWRTGVMSLNPSRGVHAGDTVVIDYCLPLAFYMGFSEIYLVGCDMDYGLDKAEDFSQAYFYARVMPMDPTLLEYHRTQFYGNVIRSYEVARDLFARRGRRIYNATRGGRVEVFPRVELERLFAH